MSDLLLLTHSKSASTGTTKDWCNERRISFDQIPAEEFIRRERRETYQAVIVFGGDMESWETEKYPWLDQEKDFLADCLKLKKPVFGICLGAELVAEQLGAAVTPMADWEIGWYPIKLQNGETLVPLHFHSACFTLPKGAERIALGTENANQGFKIGTGIVACQFHTEIDERRLKDVLENLSPDQKGVVQNEMQIKEGYAQHAQQLKDWYFHELDLWWGSSRRSLFS